jgi:hypothetical protein
LEEINTAPGSGGMLYGDGYSKNLLIAVASE